jgi:hypothetical protein
MEQNILSKRRIKQLILIGLFILLILFIYFTNLSLTFHVVSINPSLSDINSITPYIDINFNDTLKQKISISSDPNIIKSYAISGKRIRLYFNLPLNSNSKYTISLSSVTDQNNHKLNLSYSFTPIFKVNNLSKQENQYLLNQQVQYNQASLNNQLMAILPFTSPNNAYEVNYRNVNGFVIIVTAQGEPNQQAALAWLKAEGYNINNYHIQYVNQAP